MEIHWWEKNQYNQGMRNGNNVLLISSARDHNTANVVERWDIPWAFLWGCLERILDQQNFLVYFCEVCRLCICIDRPIVLEWYTMDWNTACWIYLMIKSVWYEKIVTFSDLILYINAIVPRIVVWLCDYMLSPFSKIIYSNHCSEETS